MPDLSNLSALSIGEIRARCLAADGPVSARLLSKLRRDPRKGVQLLCRELERRFEREREERLRLDAMLNFERILWRTGVEHIAGLDEAGTGPLAGPVVATAVIFPPWTEIEGVDDSKRLDPDRRAELESVIRARATAIGIGVAEVEEIDRLNVYHAALLAMRRAVEALDPQPQHLLVDARTVEGVAVPQSSFNKGDGIDFTIAAASILAKTWRDRLMIDFDARYPAYGFARNKGYGTAAHQRAIREHGPCPIHRRSFDVLREIQGGCSARFYAFKDELFAARTREDLARWEQGFRAEIEALQESERRKLRLLLTRRYRAL